MKTLFVVVVSFAVLVTSEAHAWNSLGHKVVAEIAWRQLDPATRQNIVDVLRRHPRFDADFAAKMDDKSLSGDKAIEDRWIFLQAATWPDIIRKNKEYDLPTWHYIDLPIFLDPSDEKAFANRLPVNISTDYPTRLPRDQMNVVQAIEHCKTAIRGRESPQVKAVAICWLLHLVGDIHQPLHCSALFSVNQLPKGDEGGNKILLVRGKNLHSLWDNLLGRQYYLKDIDKQLVELSDRERFGSTWESAGKEMDPRKWAEESHATCEAFVYADAILNAVKGAPPSDKLPPVTLADDYYTTAGEIARERIVKAGVRLGELLRGIQSGERPATRKTSRNNHGDGM